MTETMRDEKRIDTDIAQVRITRPGGRARTIFVPGNAPASEVERKAHMVAAYALGYRRWDVKMINGYGVRFDGGLYDKRNPHWTPRGPLKEQA